MQRLIARLKKHPEPAIRYKLRVNVLGEDPESPGIKRLRRQVRQSDLARSLLRNLTGSGINEPAHVYTKWQGAHWIMAVLADIGYPSGDKTLIPVRDQLQQTWLDKSYYKEFDAQTRQQAYRLNGVPVMQGRHRRCASQQSNALWSILKLGLANDDTHRFAERLLHWQWPDGGWNCDKNPDACHSSFMESILPLRALSLYADTYNDKNAAKAVTRASRIFLKRNLFLGQRSKQPIAKEFTLLHYPVYWHYDVLHGLKVMSEAGFIEDRRCSKALDLLESKQLADGGWAAEKAYYKVSTECANGNDFIDWGGSKKTIMNPWVTVDSLYVLRRADRLTSD